MTLVEVEGDGLGAVVVAGLVEFFADGDDLVLDGVTDAVGTAPVSVSEAAWRSRPLPGTAARG